MSLLDVPAISRGEFLARQTRLAAALDEAGVDAFIAEPSASTAYYFNISASYELSERPYLLMISRDAQVSYLAPKFELGRIERLPLVAENVHVYAWPEEESPYKVFQEQVPYDSIMLDEHARFMIAAGLMNAGIDVFPATTQINSLRAVKSDAELAILKGINRFTLELVRSVQQCIEVGMTQGHVTEAAEGLFSAAGVGAGFWSIVLFGDEAASPHGSHDGAGRVLKEGEFVLIDIGSSLHGYGSDVTRTILPKKGKVSHRLMDAWHLVHAAQGAALEKMVEGTPCAAVDKAARAVLDAAGLGDAFTHRLGHGLGLEMHEHPYLNGANMEESLLMNEVATNEPGVYVIGEFGIRLEDAVVVGKEQGQVLTGRRAKSPWEP
ncbi:peptidase M24, structural domain-containing protein [Protomyces lactucae-debilis]|uniref:Peptidase M24, structural domain-containing protein n=1 Tax=Protomyces lactucae-debilis TaxID=2754530 RepID=A0A1Y2F4Z3_PROLT|nr:peptidase M24, structural domain-containing protein [Protomyces lactucae-debilis]ORY78554.1 peptidase M24, structural domain-containing protein [Protomyces lactucae-debilis]